MGVAAVRARGGLRPLLANRAARAGDDAVRIGYVQHALSALPRYQALPARQGPSRNRV